MGKAESSAQKKNPEENPRPNLTDWARQYPDDAESLFYQLQPIRMLMASAKLIEFACVYLLHLIWLGYRIS